MKFVHNEICATYVVAKRAYSKTRHNAFHVKYFVKTEKKDRRYRLVLVVAPMTFTATQQWTPTIYNPNLIAIFENLHKN